MPTVTATPDPATGTILIDVEQTQSRDLFTRVVANGWGTPTFGPAWTQSGGAAAEYAVNGTQGTMTFATTNVPRRMIGNIRNTDMGFWAQATIAVAALTQPIQPSVITRYTDASNYYFAELSILPSNAVELRLRKVVLGVISTIGSAFTLVQTHAPGATWNIMMDVCGSKLRAKAWRSTVTEPGWIIEANDFDLTNGTQRGIQSVLATGNTNGSTVFTYDNSVSWVSQPVRLFRITEDGVETEVRGSPFYTFPATAASNTAIATVWDNEAPLDTRLFYRLTSFCNSTVVTGGPATLLSSSGGWIRDPQDPSKNIFIDFQDTQFNDCDATQRVEWLGWEPRVSVNASGIFPVINSPRPLTVSMNRKRYESLFGFATKTLTDMDMMEAIFAPGRILLVSLPVEYGFGRGTYGSDYITVMDLVEANVDTNDFGTPFRSWEVPFQLSYAPPDVDEGLIGENGIGGGGATYADITASAIGVTYTATIATLLTYQQLAQGQGY